MLFVYLVINSLNELYYCFDIHVETKTVGAGSSYTKDLTLQNGYHPISACCLVENNGEFTPIFRKKSENEWTFILRNNATVSVSIAESDYRITCIKSK